jgi:hypothetical protein
MYVKGGIWCHIQLEGITLLIPYEGLLGIKHSKVFFFIVFESNTPHRRFVPQLKNPTFSHLNKEPFMPYSGEEGLLSWASPTPKDYGPQGYNPQIRGGPGK